MLARVAKSKARRRPPVKVPEPEPAPDPQPKPESEAVSEPAPVSAAAAAKELETAERELRMVRYRRASVMEMCLPPAADNDEQDDGDDRRLLGDCDDGGGERGGTTTTQPGVHDVEAEQQQRLVAKIDAEEADAEAARNAAEAAVAAAALHEEKERARAREEVEALRAHNVRQPCMADIRLHILHVYARRVGSRMRKQRRRGLRGRRVIKKRWRLQHGCSSNSAEAVVAPQSSHTAARWLSVRRASSWHRRTDNARRNARPRAPCTTR